MFYSKMFPFVFLDEWEDCIAPNEKEYKVQVTTPNRKTGIPHTQHNRISKIAIPFNSPSNFPLDQVKDIFININSYLMKHTISIASSNR